MCQDMRNEFRLFEEKVLGNTQLDEKDPNCRSRESQCELSRGLKGSAENS